MKHDDIMIRMKENYESRSKTFLIRRTPVIIRIDGKAFHTYTKGLNKPFDEDLIEDMQSTAIYLCQHIQGAKCAYTQSDEISILVTDFDTLTTDAWFDYNVQKMTSVSASLATGIFNYLRFQRYYSTNQHLIEHFGATEDEIQMEEVYYKIDVADIINYFPIKQLLANFDSRVFNIPPDEVGNYFYARQRDAVKNSISMLAQSLYSHKELHGKNGNEMQEMCFQKGHNWNDLHWSEKRGSFIIKNLYVNNEIASIENGLFKENEDWYKIDPIVSGKVMTNTKLENPIIRSKWEIIETPERFTQANFVKFL